MKSLPKTNRANSGFALVVSLSLMVLLAMMAVGLLSLSSIALKSSSLSDAREHARNNARLALMMALDKLQMELGPDQRISANAATLDTNPVTEAVDGVPHPHWLGVWDSWIAGSLSDAEVNPDYPSTASHHQTVGGVSQESLRPDYNAKANHFRSWLVSGSADALTQTNAAASGGLNLSASRMPDSNHDGVVLVAEGSLGENANAADKVEVPLVSIVDNEDASTTGRYGWWISDESQKALVMQDSYETGAAVTAANKIYRSQAPGSTGTSRVLGLEDLQDDDALGSLPSLKTLDLLAAEAGEVNADDTPSMRNFHSITSSSFGILADVREGGLKRDLNTILEQPIERNNAGDEYMLYAFDDPRFQDRSNSRVPIQDLAAYYQLYDDESQFGNQRREGVRYNSSALPNAIQARVPDHDGGSKNRQRILREYTSLYKQPVITKVQFLVAVTAQPITDADRQEVLDRIADDTQDEDGNDGQTSDRWQRNLEPIPEDDTHKLRLGIMPMITLWNPTNIPMVMDSQQILRFSTPPFGMQLRKASSGGETYDSKWFNLNYASAYQGGSTNGQASGFCLLRLSFARNASDRIVFDPGEVKVFSLPSDSGATLGDDGNVLSLVSEGTNRDVVNEWDPYGFFLVHNSVPHGHYGSEAPHVYKFLSANQAYGQSSQPGEVMVFNDGDSFSLSIDKDTYTGERTYGLEISNASEIKGAGFNLYMLDAGYQERWQDQIDFLRHYQMLSRHGGSPQQIAEFSGNLITPGFPGGEAPLPFDSPQNTIPGSEIIASAAASEVVSLMEFSLNLGCEAASLSAGGYGGGRRITSRPFLHSPLNAAPFIDQSDLASLYNYAWDWQLGRVNTVEDSIITAKPNSGNGYFGGGYTIEHGTTHVVQQEVPTLPPISIAALSHARLGGFSLAYNNIMGDEPETDTYWFKSTRLKEPVGNDFQKVTATGQAGLAPHITQAIGNSYAHPSIPANQAFTTKVRHFDGDEGATDPTPFVDHSYLANKALWDDYFFSSITPQPLKVQLYGSSENLTALQVAESFFDGSKPLPNRRLTPYPGDLDPDVLSELFSESNLFTNGLADKIASHLMVNGAFNVNSTSVNAWKVLLSSLRGKPVAYLESGRSPSEATPEGTTFGVGMLPNGEPIQSSSISSPNMPEEQWTAARELTDAEIDELANAIVKQVKLRGPFLSLSEFVNRRLEGASFTAAAERSVKGALQAALDDNGVSINSAFRVSGRLLDTEASGINFEFPLAATGPIAYGSAPYVDQADILRGFAAQLTPRGDTFVIRAYGDSLDANGIVKARAWCQATVQRIPEYTDRSDSAHWKQSQLTESNKKFGRKFRVVSLRWLNPSEI